MYSYDAVKKARLEIMNSGELSQKSKEIIAILMVAVMQQENREIETWGCDCDCYAAGYSYCSGEHGVVKNSKNICPYYSPEDK